LVARGIGHKKGYLSGLALGAYGHGLVLGGKVMATLGHGFGFGKY